MLPKNPLKKVSQNATKSKFVEKRKSRGDGGCKYAINPISIVYCMGLEGCEPISKDIMTILLFGKTGQAEKISFDYSTGS
ncbi:hypothetical protein KAU15_06625 [candidate division WOR-3 bacterium]|nr:hypothetical protein [candidate division WOR-3 bacterium]